MRKFNNENFVISNKIIVQKFAQNISFLFNKRQNLLLKTKLILKYFLLQAKRTKKVGIVGKYGTRYGASLRKMVKKMEITQHSKYTCSFCGKVSYCCQHIVNISINALFICFRIPWSVPALVSGPASVASASLPVVPGFTLPLLLPPFALLSVVFVKPRNNKLFI